MFIKVSDQLIRVSDVKQVFKENIVNGWKVVVKLEIDSAILAKEVIEQVFDNEKDAWIELERLHEELNR